MSAQLENVLRVSLGNKNDFLQRSTLTLNGMLNKKKNYILKMMLLHPNLAANARIVFKLCSLLITTLTYNVLKA